MLPEMNTGGFEAWRLEGAGIELLEGVQQPQNQNFPYQVAQSIPYKLSPSLAYPSALLVIHTVPSTPRYISMQVAMLQRLQTRAF